MQLKIFADEETGASHRQLDNPTIGRQFIFDWLKDQLRLGEPLGCSPFRRQMFDQHAADGVTPGPRIAGSAIRGTDVGSGVRLARIQLKLKSCLLHPPPDYRERLGHVPQFSPPRSANIVSFNFLRRAESWVIPPLQAFFGQGHQDHAAIDGRRAARHKA